MAPPSHPHFSLTSGSEQLNAFALILIRTLK
jgi:hypothetical protein